MIAELFATSLFKYRTDSSESCKRISCVIAKIFSELPRAETKRIEVQDDVRREAKTLGAKFRPRSRERAPPIDAENFSCVATVQRVTTRHTRARYRSNNDRFRRRGANARSMPSAHSRVIAEAHSADRRAFERTSARIHVGARDNFCPARAGARCEPVGDPSRIGRRAGRPGERQPDLSASRCCNILWRNGLRHHIRLAY